MQFIHRNMQTGHVKRTKQMQQNAAPWKKNQPLVKPNLDASGAWCGAGSAKAEFLGCVNGDAWVSSGS